jgi:hypothetical protein
MRYIVYAPESFKTSKGYVKTGFIERGEAEIPLAVTSIELTRKLKEGNHIPHSLTRDDLIIYNRDNDDTYYSIVDKKNGYPLVDLKRIC